MRAGLASSRLTTESCHACRMSASALCRGCARQRHWRSISPFWASRYPLKSVFSSSPRWALELVLKTGSPHDGFWTLLGDTKNLSKKRMSDDAGSAPPLYSKAIATSLKRERMDVARPQEPPAPAADPEAVMLSPVRRDEDSRSRSHRGQTGSSFTPTQPILQQRRRDQIDNIALLMLVMLPGRPGPVLLMVSAQSDVETSRKTQPRFRFLRLSNTRPKVET